MIIKWRSKLCWKIWVFFFLCGLGGGISCYAFAKTGGGSEASTTSALTDNEVEYVKKNSPISSKLEGRIMAKENP